MPEEVNGVLQVTGLTPQPVETPVAEAPAPVETPAAPPAEVAGVAQDTEQPADSEGTTEDEESPASTTAQAPGAPGKPARGVQKALDRLASQANEWREIAKAQAQIISAREQLTSAPAAPVQPAQQAPADPIPERNAVNADGTAKYPTWESHQAAVVGWQAREASRGVVKQELTQFASALIAAQQMAEQNARQEKIAMTIKSAVDKAPERIPDWNETVKASPLPMTQELYEIIADTPDPARFMYHLATHPDEYMQLVKMDKMSLKYNTGRIVGALSAPPAVPNAPPPAKPIGGRASSSPEYRDDFTPAQHKAWLAKVQRSA